MTLDGLTLKAIVGELRTSILPCKIEKIHQPERDELLFVLHTPAGKKRLVLSANSVDCRLHLTEYPKPNPMNAPLFCMFLRKHIAGGHIAAIEQAGLERVVQFTIEAKDELGCARKLILVLEIMGKHSNIILLDESGKILESIKHVSFDMSSVRQVFPGMEYQDPKMAQYDPGTISISTLAEVLAQSSRPLAHCLVETLQGVSFQTAAEILTRAFGETVPEHATPAQAEHLSRIAKEFVASSLAKPAPCIQLNMDLKPVFYSLVPYAAYAGAKAVCYDTTNEMLDAFFHLRTEIAVFQQKQAHLQKSIHKDIARLQKKLKIQLQTLEDAKSAESVRQKGDLITANIYQLKRGMRQFNAIDYMTGEPVSISLDPTLSPSANAQKFYKRYNKLKTAFDIASKQAKTCQKELEFLASVEYHLQSAGSLDDLDEIRFELTKTGYLSAPKKEAAKRPSQLSSPLSFLSSDGIQIYAGKNNRQNDLLTLKQARATDIWLHTKDIPGSHVIVCSDHPPQRTLHEAAIIAATHSKAKNSGKIPVDYCPRSHVKKPGGAKPGMVIYEGYQTILAEPDEALVKTLEKK